MISRVAEHCFWLSRYLERAENTARILEVNQTLVLDFALPFEQQWKPVLIISGIHDFEGSPDSETVQNLLTWDQDNPCSIAASMSYARENARIIREVISEEMWERINFYYLWLHSPPAREMYDQNRGEFYGQIRRINQLIHGIGEATMFHGESWDFQALGKFVERGIQTARILDVKYHLATKRTDAIEIEVDHAHWSAILKSCSAYEPFHKRAQQGLERRVGVAVAHFLVLEERFPRSVTHCVHQCQLAAAAIAAGAAAIDQSEVDQQLHSLREWLHGEAIESQIETHLHESLTHVVDRLHDIGEAIRKTYFEFKPERYVEMAVSTQSQSSSK